MKTELREAAVITVAVALVGVLLGLLWVWLAPQVPLVGELSDGSWVVYLKDTEGEQAIGVDGTFILLALAFGARAVRRRSSCARRRGGSAAGRGAGRGRAARVGAGLAARGVAGPDPGRGRARAGRSARA